MTPAIGNSIIVSYDRLGRDSILTSISVTAEVCTPLHECRSFLGSRSHGPQSNGTSDGRVCESRRGRNHAVCNEIVDTLLMEGKDRYMIKMWAEQRERGEVIYDSQSDITACQGVGSYRMLFLLDLLRRTILEFPCDDVRIRARALGHFRLLKSGPECGKLG